MVSMMKTSSNMIVSYQGKKNNQTRKILSYCKHQNNDSDDEDKKTDFNEMLICLLKTFLLRYIKC